MLIVFYVLVSIVTVRYSSKLTINSYNIATVINIHFRVDCSIIIQHTSDILLYRWYPRMVSKLCINYNNVILSRDCRVS